MASERVAFLQNVPGDPEQKAKYLETLLLKVESEHQEERSNMLRRIKHLELTLGKLKKKHSALKKEYLSLKTETKELPSIKQLEDSYKQILSEKEETCKLNLEQIEFLKKEYRELEERSSGFSLEYIKDTVGKLFCKLPVMNGETEKIIQLLMTMLGFSAFQKLEIQSSRTEHTKSKKSILSKIFQVNTN